MATGEMIDNNTYNPFAVAPFYKFHKTPPSDQQDEKERLRKAENFKKLTEAIEIIHNLKLEDFNDDDIQRIDIGRLFDFRYKEMEFRNYRKKQERRILLTEMRRP